MDWTIDPAHSSVGFSARHLGLSKVRGLFTRFSGEIEGDPSDLTTASGRFDVEMGSIDTGSPDRDAHLKGADFFDVEKHPTMTFVSRSVRSTGDGYSVVGDLTIKETTREVSLDLEPGGETTDPYGNRKVGGTLTGTINRSDWGLTWNVPLDSGGWLVSEKIGLEIDLQVAESKAAVEEEVAAEEALSA